MKDWLLDSRIRVFATVARHMSFTVAAAALEITQPAVSLQIRSLETALGTRLFKRSSSGLELTEVGAALLRHSEQLFDQARRIDNDITALSGVLKGTLGVAVSMAIGTYVLPAIIARFLEEHRACTIETLLGNSRIILEHVVDETVDVGIVSDPVDRRDVVIEPLLEDEVVLVVPPGHRWAARGYIAPAELASEPFIMRESGSGTRKVFEASLRQVGLSTEDLDVVASIGGFEAANAAVMCGIGVTVAPSMAVREEVANGRLTVVRWNDVPMRRFFNVVYSKRSPLPERVERFLACAREIAAARAVAAA
jgi:LysR family transcriptional regulator, transcriptional activator of the cysJI operon